MLQKTTKYGIIYPTSEKWGDTMNIVFLIGNGFDLNLGLKTRYRNFYDYYVALPSKNTTIEKFKEVLSDNLDNWADLELELGKYANNFGKEIQNDLVVLLYDIQDALANYLDKQDADFTITEEDRKKAINDLLEFEKYLNEREREEFYSYKKPFQSNTFQVEIVTFNYTKTFEKIYGWNGRALDLGIRKVGSSSYGNRMDMFEHIHGTTESNMILGVNDVSQIENEELRNSILIRRALIKTEMNVNAGTMRDDRCVKAIERADVICIYGMSLGDTDRFWWDKVGLRVAKSNARLFVFSKVEDLPLRRAYIASNKKDEVKNLFVSHLDFDEPSKEKIKKQTFVCLNSNMFKVKLNYPEKKTPLQIANENADALTIAQKVLLSVN